MQSVAQRIVAFNAGRDRALLAYKYRKMQHDPSTFFRGTCHLFYEDLAASAPVNADPLVWLCGDLHLENFGSYRDESGSVRFDINDFDDAILAPCTWDVVRMVTSLLVAARTFKLDSDSAEALGSSFLEAYCATMQTGQPSMLDAINPPTVVQKLMTGVQDRRPRDLLDDRTKKKKKRDIRELKIIEDRTMKAPPANKARIMQALEEWRAKQAKPSFDTVSDIAQRISGTGSLGLENYVVLVEMRQLAEQYAVLHLKQAVASALAPHVKAEQPNWSSQARRIIGAYRRLQGASPLLVPIGDGEHSYVLHDLQPSADRVELKKVVDKPRQLKALIALAGQITAWDHLRSADHDGTVSAQALIDFASQSAWQKSIMSYAKSYTKRVDAYFAEFGAANVDKLTKP